jgi:uncharacterized membrane protein
MKTIHKPLFLTLTLLTIGLIACKHNPQEEATPILNNPSNNTTNDSVSFQTEILPLLIGNCAMGVCHDANSAADGVVLNNYTNVINTGRVRAFNPNNSELYDVLLETDPDKRMPRPPAAPLSQAQIALIAKWINQGARNTNIIRCDTNTFTFGTVQTIINNNCGGCHSSSNPQGGVNLSDYNNIKQQTQSGKLLGSINHLPGNSAMPKGGNKLESCKITIIQKWAAAGYLNN